MMGSEVLFPGIDPENRQENSGFLEKVEFLRLFYRENVSVRQILNLTLTTRIIRAARFPEKEASGIFSINGGRSMEKLEKPLDSWRDELTDEQFHVCRLGGTERAFTGEYHDTKTPGIYHCVCCGTALFDSDAKYDSGSGWPSYFQPVNGEVVKELEDFSHGMHRIEVRCGKCDSHLGHVFPDGPRPTGLRYCINSASLKLVPKE